MFKVLLLGCLLFHAVQSIGKLLEQPLHPRPEQNWLLQLHKACKW
jgi:hypothetical protein